MNEYLVDDLNAIPSNTQVNWDAELIWSGNQSFVIDVLKELEEYHYLTAQQGTFVKMTTRNGSVYIALIDDYGYPIGRDNRGLKSRLVNPPTPKDHVVVYPASVLPGDVYKTSELMTKADAENYARVCVSNGTVVKVK